jgi:general secretion pathway protein A
VYADFFGLNEKPFSITPDPRYLYLSPRHADALAHLLYGISESGGFIQLTGEVGTGKTTLIRSVLEQLPDKAEVALILNPRLSPQELLQSICEELRICLPADRSVKALVDTLNAELLRANAEGRRIVLMIDEAQTLAPELIEQVRLLTNLETPKQKLLQIILIGQPELRDMLGRPEMRQVAQRVTGRYHLEPLSAQETAGYVRHRLRVAGAQREIFKPGALRQLYKDSGGIPRLINVVADRTLLAAYTQEQSAIDRGLVKHAAREVFGKRRGPLWPWAAVALGLVALVLATGTQRDPPATAPATALVAPPAASGVAESLAPEVTAAGAQNPVAVPVAEATLSAVNATDAAPPDAGAAQAHTVEEPTALAALLADAAYGADSTPVLHTLFGAWQATYDPAGGAPCAQAVDQQLQCLTLDHGSVGELRKINRPAMLTLVDDAGRDRYVVVTQLDFEGATLTFEDQTARIGIADLTRYWYGENLVLWRPIFADSPLLPGSRSESVLWLRDSIQRVFGLTLASADPLHYDDALVEKVREFQRREQLKIDGIVGVETQISLQAVLGTPEVPLLSERR